MGNMSNESLGNKLKTQAKFLLVSFNNLAEGMHACCTNEQGGSLDVDGGRGHGQTKAKGNKHDPEMEVPARQDHWKSAWDSETPVWGKVEPSLRGGEGEGQEGLEGKGEGRRNRSRKAGRRHNEKGVAM